MVAQYLIPQSAPEVILELIQLFKSPYLKQIRQEYSDAFDDTRSWVDPGGYRLSDRLWKQKAHVRQWIDQEIRFALENGTDAMELADRLETALYPHLQPVRDANGKIIDTGAKGVLTRTPRNGPGSYAARRLARTEITRAFGQAVDTSAEALGLDVRWRLSNRHPKVDICDENASGSSDGKPMGVYTVKECPQYPAHPHCLCTKSTYDDRSDDDVLAYIRQKYDIPAGPLPPPLPPVKKKPGPPKGYKYPQGAKKPGPKPKIQGPALLSDQEVAAYASRADKIQAAAAKKAQIKAKKQATWAAKKKAAEEASAKKAAADLAAKQAAMKAKAATSDLQAAAAKKAAMQKKLQEEAAKKAAAEAAAKKLQEEAAAKAAADLAAKKAAIKAKKQATWQAKKDAAAKKAAEDAAAKAAADAAAKAAADLAAKKAAAKAKKQATWAAKKQAKAQADLQAAIDAQKASAQAAQAATQAAQKAQKVAAAATPPPISGILPSGVTAPKSALGTPPSWKKQGLDPNAPVTTKKPGTFSEADAITWIDDSEIKEILYYKGGYNATPALKSSGINFNKTKPELGDPDFRGAGLKASNLPTGSPNEVKLVVRSKSPLQGTGSQLEAEISSWNLNTAGLTPAQASEAIRLEALARGYDSIVEILPSGSRNVYVIRQDNYRIVQDPVPAYTPPPSTPSYGSYKPQPAKVQTPTPGPVAWQVDASNSKVYTDAQIKNKYAADKKELANVPYGVKARDDRQNYKGSAYIEQNRHLRFGHPQGRSGYGQPLPPSWDTSYIADMDTFFDGRYKLEGEAHLWRGTKHSPGDTDPEIVNAKPGDILWDPAFLSTSYNSGIADSFKGGYSGKDTVLYRITAPAGAPYIPLDALGITEQELVFPRGTRMVVTNVDKRPRNGGGTAYTLDVTLAPATPETTKPKVPTKLRGGTP
jgi:hypothetical protein